MICVVQKQFPGPNGNFAVGERVDTSTWRPLNVESLLRSRHLQPVAFSEVTEEKPKTKLKVKTTKVTKQKRVFDDN